MRKSQKGDLNPVMLKQDLELFKASFIDDLDQQHSTTLVRGGIMNNTLLIQKEYVNMRFKELKDYFALKSSNAEIKSS